MASGVKKICVSSTFFQKNDIGWPQQPPTEKVPEFNMIFHDSTPQKRFFQNIKIKLNSNTWMNLKSSVVIFQALKPLQPQWPQWPQQPQWPQWPQQPHFIKKIYWSQWFDHPQHPNDQYQSLFVEWIIKNPIFHWYLILSLLKAVEASRCHFFKNWLMKHKFFNLLKPLGTIIQ